MTFDPAQAWAAAGGPSAMDADREAAEWTPAADPLDAPSELTAPDILRADGGGALLYRGRRHVISAEPEGLKSWLAAAAAGELLQAGEAVVWIDSDGMGRGVLVERLQILGTPDAAMRAHLLHLAPELPMRDAGRDALALVLDERPVALAVIDAFNASLELQGLSALDSGDVQTFYRDIVGLFHNRGIATLLIDHVTKSKETRGSWAFGSERKVGAADVHIGLELIGEPPTRDRPQGRVLLKAHKDRPGAHRRGPQRRIGEFHLDTTTTPGWRLDLSPELATPAGGTRTFRPTHLMERVSRHVEIAPAPVSKTTIVTEVKGKAEALRTAVDVLTEEGYLERVTGRQPGAWSYRATRPYREADDAETGEPRPNPVPPGTATDGPTPSPPRPHTKPHSHGDPGNPVPPGPTPSPAPARNPVPGGLLPTGESPGRDGVRTRTELASPSGVGDLIDDDELARYQTLATTETEPPATGGTK